MRARDVDMVFACAHLVYSDRLGSSPPRPAALSIRGGDARGTRIICEGQVFNVKAALCGRIISLDMAAFVFEMQLAFPQEVQR